MKKILVVVDYQNDFVSGSLGFVGADKLDDLIAAKIGRALAEGTEVVCTLDTHGGDYLSTREGRNLPVPHCIRGTEGWKLFGRSGELAYANEGKGVSMLEKGQFGSLELAEILKAGGYDEVELCGLVSNICVVSNALIASAALPQARIVVDSKATSCMDPAANDAALCIMKSCQVDVI